MIQVNVDNMLKQFTSISRIVCQIAKDADILDTLTRSGRFQQKICSVHFTGAFNFAGGLETDFYPQNMLILNANPNIKTFDFYASLCARTDKISLYMLAEICTFSVNIRTGIQAAVSEV